MSKLKMSWSCYNCHSSDTVDSTENLDGCCPECMSHHGEVEYSCDMTVEEFLTVLSEMSESEIAKNAHAINECAYDLKNNL